MTTPVTPVPDASQPLPDPSDLGTWPARMAETHRWMRETLRPGVNALAASAYDNALTASAAANFVGSWSALSGALAVPASVVHSGKVWMLLSSLADVTLSEPGVAADWFDITPLGRSGGVIEGDLDVPSLNGGQLAGHRNRVINGNFLVNQEAVSGTVVLAAGAYGHDQWKAGASGCTYTFASSGGVTTLTITAGSLIQPIEGVSLQTGTHVLSWQGTAQGKIGAGSYGATGVSAAVTGGSNLNIEFSTGTLSLVQLERGTRATPFEHRHVSTEETLCRRFLQVGENVSLCDSVASSGGTYKTATVQLSPPMRAVPTVTRTTSSAGTVSVSGVSTRSIRFLTTTAPSNLFSQVSTWKADARL